MKFKFDVYLDKIESIIPKFGKSGKNKSVQLTKDIYEGEELVKPGYEACWEATTEKNSVEVQVQVKKHNKQAFFEAIESQLMYMPNILFLHRELNAITHQEIDIKAKIEYRDENIIISKTTVYNKPHILLGTGDVLINYGFLSFPELELEPKGGAVGLIMDINEIEVTPSREAPIWSTKTRKAILEKYEKVTETATKYVTEEIGNETDYLLWMRKASSIISSIKTGASFGSSETSDALSTLASIIDVSEIKNLKFAPDLRIVLYNEVEKMFGDQFYLRVITFDSWSKKVNRDKSKSINSLIYPIYLTFLGANKYKDRYIYEEKGQFLLITAKEEYKEAKKWKLIDESSIYTLYDSLDVPEDRLALYTQDENDDEDGDDDLATLSTKTRAELRKENKKIVVHYANKDTSGSWVFSARDRSISDMFNLQPGENVMYGTGNDRNIMKTILELLPAYFTGGISSKFYDKSTDSTLTAILVAKENLKYISNSSRFQSVPSIFIDSYDKNTGHLVLASRIQYVITAIFVQLYSESLITDKACSISRIVREGYRSDKLITLLGDTKELKQVCNYLFETVYHVSIISTIKRTAQDVEFIKKLGRLQLIDEKLIDSSEEDRETLITEINDNLPDFLCDDIEEIKTVEALFPDLFKQCVDLIKKINLGWPIISLFIDKYYYRDEDMEHVAEDVKFYLKLKADDASL